MFSATHHAATAAVGTANAAATPRARVRPDTRGAVDVEGVVSEGEGGGAGGGIVWKKEGWRKRAVWRAPLNSVPRGWSA